MEFSVIVPVYNSEKYLQECVGSVLEQSFGDFEMIIVDDGSGADCAAACDDIAKLSSDIRVIHRKNAGQLYARLAGVDAAKGEYCVFLDADDTLLPDCLKTLSEAAKRHRKPDMLVYGFYYDAEGSPPRASALLFDGEREFAGSEKTELYRLFFTGTGLNSIWTKAVGREVFDRLTEDLSPYRALRCSEDRLMSMLLTEASDAVVYLPERLYSYRVAPGSFTRRYTPDAVGRFDTRALYPFEREFIKRHGISSPDEVSRLNASYVSQALYVFESFYTNMPDKSDRKKLLAYPWQTLIPDEAADYENNSLLNETQKKLFGMILKKDYAGIELHFIKKKLRKAAKKLKNGR
ncbi:MAG: glycosyltransferase family 2 protein [Clostridia bacterium]|nr:glycosyltransferase family 2 protein [Clostridia bacterium]